MSENCTITFISLQKDLNLSILKKLSLQRRTARPTQNSEIDNFFIITKLKKKFMCRTSSLV